MISEEKQWFIGGPDAFQDVFFWFSVFWLNGIQILKENGKSRQDGKGLTNTTFLENNNV